jgi:hypothetical protein
MAGCDQAARDKPQDCVDQTHDENMLIPFVNSATFFGCIMR